MVARQIELTENEHGFLQREKKFDIWILENPKVASP